MAEAAIALPDGFVLDKPQGNAQLPAGFALDSPPAQQGAGQGSGTVNPGDPDFNPGWNAGKPYSRQFTVPLGNSSQDNGDNIYDQIYGKPTKTASAVRGALQGASLGFSDESRGLAEASGMSSLIPGAQIVGGARMLGEKVAPSVFGHSATDRYNTTVEAERRANEDAQQTNPASYFGGEVGGSVASMAGLPAFAPFKAAGTTAKLGNAAVTGGAYGAVAGAGAGEGDPIERLPSAIQGAEFGAAAGPVIGAVASGAGKLARGIGNQFRSVVNPAGAADRILADATSADSANLPAIADRMQAAQDQGQPLTLADVAGTNTQGKAGSAARFPGPAQQTSQQFLQTRQFGNETTPSQGERITQQLTDLTGGDAGSLSTAKGIIQKRGAQVAPLYKRGDVQPIDYGSTAGQKLTAALDRVPNGAKSKANEILQIEDAGGTQPIWRQGPDGNFELQAAPNVKQWRYIRQGLDAAIENDRGIDGRVGTIGNKLQGLRKEISDALHEVSPLTKQADNIFAGDSKMLDALRAGKKAFNPSMTREAVKMEVAGLTPGEQEMYRLGAINALKEKISGAADSANKAKIAAGSRSIREKIAVIVPNGPQRTAFLQALDNEKAMFETAHKALGGSPTAPRMNEDTELLRKAAENAHVISSIAQFNWKAALGAAARHLAKVDPAKRAQVLKAINDIALDPNPDTVRAFAERITAANLNPGVFKSVVGVVTKALPRTLTTDKAGRDERNRQRASRPVPQSP